MALLTLRRELEPFGAFAKLQQELGQVFENPLSLSSERRNGNPPVSVFEDEDTLTVEFEIPGVPAENVSIENRGQTLVVSGKREPNVPSGAKAHREEHWFGEFSRTLELPAHFDPSNATAEHRNGVLSIRVPKREEAKPRLIEVKTS